MSDFLKPKKIESVEPLQTHLNLVLEEVVPKQINMLEEMVNRLENCATISGIDDLKDKLTKLGIRFDTDPKLYQKPDFWLLVCILYRSLIHLYESNPEEIIVTDWLDPHSDDYIPSEKLVAETIESLSGDLSQEILDRILAVADLAAEIATKQDTLIAGDNISIDENNSISALGYTYNTTKHSFAEGTSTASGMLSHAEGSGTEALEDYSHAEGYNSAVHPAEPHASSTPVEDAHNGYAAHAEGNATLAGGSGAHSEGKLTTAFGCNSHAEGVSTGAGGVAAHSEGEATKAIGDNSHAEGYGEYSAVWAQATSTAGSNILSVPYVEGDSPTTQNIGYIITTSPDYSIPGHQYKIVDVNASVNPILVTLDSELRSTRTQQYYMLSGVAYSDNSHVEGSYNTASGVDSHAEGSGNLSSGLHSHTEGDSNVASGQSSHVEGGSNIATADCGHAEGAFTKSKGLCTHTEGFYTEAKNIAEHAEGYNNVSHKANGVWGDARNTLHSIGMGGTSLTNRNAFEVMQNGDVYLYGVGNYDGTTVKASGNPVQTLQDKLDEIEGLAAAGLVL